MASLRYQLDWKPYRRRFTRPLRTAHGVWREREGLLVRLRTPDGRSGYGEVAPMPAWGTETLREAGEYLETLGPEFEGGRLAAVPGGLRCTAFALGCAQAGAEKRWFLPRPQLLRLPVAALIDLAGPLADEVPQRLAAGYRVFKAKIGLANGFTERQQAQELLERLGPEALLRLDANGGLDVAEARRWLKWMWGRPVEFLEQPLPRAATAGLVELGREFGPMVALEESVQSLAEIHEWAERGWAGPVVVKPSLLGAPSAWAELWTRCSWPWVFSTAFETGIGAAGALRVAFALAHEPRALGFGTERFLGQDGFAFDRLGGAVLDHDWVLRQDPAEIWERAG